MTEQTIEKLQAIDTTFLDDVIAGLSGKQKSLPSRYFYDEVGDKLFQKIMHLEEYYPMRCEYEILNTEKDSMLSFFLKDSRGFNLIEYGAGDAYKTRVLIQYFVQKGIDFIYSPVDISENVLNILEQSLTSKFKDLHIDKVAAEYFDALDIINKRHCDKKVILFLGSNIGNFSPEDTEKFFRSISDKCQQGDLFLIGFDLQKDPATILNAYNDSEGITREFNLNLLRRINNELAGDFNLDLFYHYPTYDPISGEAKSFLVSRSSQTLTIGDPPEKFHFKKGESIFTEISRKYTIEQIDKLATETGFRVIEKYFDTKGYFCDAVLEVI